MASLKRSRGIIPVCLAVVLVTRDVSGTLLSLATSHAAFALDLYENLVSRKPHENVIFSPTSVSTAMAMLQLGARGSTKRQLTKVMHFDLVGDDLHRSFVELNRILYKPSSAYTLKSANRIFGKIGVNFSKYYLSNAQRYYGSTVETFDFSDDPEGARSVINTWVSNNTNNRIADLIPRGVLDASTLMIIVNAIYFKGSWASPFKKSETAVDDFYVSTDSIVTAEFMYQKGYFNYGRDERRKFDILELPYAGEQLGFYIILPDDTDGLPVVESQLSVMGLSRTIASMRRTDVQIWMPKFTFTQELSLRGILSQLGLPSLFDPELADLSAMNGRKDLYVSDIVHKSFIEINEQGSEVSSASGIIVAKTAYAPPVEFNVNHPFVFMIREKKSGSVLFVGRVVKPTTTQNAPRVGGYRTEPIEAPSGESSHALFLTVSMSILALSMTFIMHLILYL